MAQSFRGDPLKRMPPAHEIRRKLEETREYARRLEILLETAERVEAAKADPSPSHSATSAGGGRTHAGAH